MAKVQPFKLNPADVAHHGGHDGGDHVFGAGMKGHAKADETKPRQRAGAPQLRPVGAAVGLRSHAVLAIR